jgi:hypothetical protein
MAITVTNVAKGRRVDMRASEARHGSLTISGLTAASANTIPHGLPFTPKKISLRPGANGLWGETSIPDATNIYITVGTGGATAGTIDYEE